MLKKEKMKTNYLVILGILIFFIGIFLFSYNYLNKKIKVELEDMNISLFFEENKNIFYDENINDSEETTESASEEEKKEYNNNYIATLEIPKINLKRGFTNKYSKYNTIAKNIQILSISSLPNQENGNVILAAHAGNSNVSFFKDLYKLALNDKAYIYYNNVKYTYKLINIYYQEKTGYLAIKRDYNKTVLTLITCTYKNKTTQTVQIFELVEKEDY